MSQKQKVAPSDRVPVHQKVAYGLGTANDMWGNWLYPTMVWPVFNMFLQVNPVLVSTALMLNRLIDAASDPFFGWLSDNTRSRWGRRRPFILIGSILAGIFLPMLFMVSPLWSEAALFWFMLVSSAFYITIVSSYNMPYQSLGNELTPDYTERTSVFAYKGSLQKISEVAGFSFAMFATSTVWIGATFSEVPARLKEMIGLFGSWWADAFTAIFSGNMEVLVSAAKNPFYWNTGIEGQPNVLLGAQVFTIGIGTMMILLGVLMFFSLKERYYKKVVETNQEKIGITETIYKTLQCRPFRPMLAMSLSYGLSTSMLGSLGYYMTVYYVCHGNITVGSAWNFGMGLASMLCGLIGVPFFATIAKYSGKRPAMAAVQLSAMAVFIASWWLYNPMMPWLQLLASGSIAFTQGGFWSLHGAIGADVIDYDELQTGKRREGAFTATGTYIMKVGLALGIFFSGVVLTWTGFDAALGADQDPQALTNIRISFAAIPIGGLILAFFALMTYPLSKSKMAEIRSDLEAKRGIV